MGRLSNSDSGIGVQKPIILQCDHILIKITIIECHTRIYHGGIKTTLTKLEVSGAERLTNNQKSFTKACNLRK